MSLGNHLRARSILYLGAQSISESSDGATGYNSDEFARLFHTWAVCEWHLRNLDCAEVLFDHALRLTDSGEDGSEIRSLVLYSIARFLFHAREDSILAQHCVCLSLKESTMPGGSSKIWQLWSDIAHAMENESLSDECIRQAKRLQNEEETSDISRMLGMRAPLPGVDSISIPSRTRPALQQMVRRAPWYHKIFSLGKRRNE